MDRNFVAALAVLVILAGGALFFVDAAHERIEVAKRGAEEETRAKDRPRSP